MRLSKFNNLQLARTKNRQAQNGNTIKVKLKRKTRREREGFEGLRLIKARNRVYLGFIDVDFITASHEYLFF